tara:strand:- start:733 stop:1188 length:456 start_codon:yes stop_codon:yes gene_type:complete
MELKRLIIFIYSIFFLIPVYGELINPNEKLKPYDVIKIQLEALKKNNVEDEGIKQTWLFAHPNNKKVTGPYERFRIMIYGQQYQHLINHNSHKIKLLMNNSNKFIYKIEILDKNKQLFFYEWHVEKGSEKECKNCWFTSAVSRPVDQGNTI